MAPPSSVTVDPRGGGGLPSVLRREPLSKRPRRASYDVDDDGTPLTDELLIAIFATCPDLADLVRFAATCRRWRRLVSADAAFLCRTPRRLPAGRFVARLAVGFFHHHDAADSAPRFVPTTAAAAASRNLVRQPPLSALLINGGGMFEGSFPCVVASRNGLVVVELRRGKAGGGGALKLCVCNPMTGAAHVLPPLGVNDGLGGGHYEYTCTVLTADDLDGGESTTEPRWPSSYFRLVVVYIRRGGPDAFLRTYSPVGGGGGWSDEAALSNAGLSSRQMRSMRGGSVLVDRGGELVCWLAKNAVFMLSLVTLKSWVMPIPWSANGQSFTMANTLLGLSPEGRLCFIQFDRMSLSPARRKRRVSICLYTYSYGKWGAEESIQVDGYLPEDTTKVRLRWFGQSSGVVFFTAVAGDSSHRRSEAYALSLGTRTVEKVASHAGGGDWGDDLHGYEDQAAYLASLTC